MNTDTERVKQAWQHSRLVSTLGNFVASIRVAVRHSRTSDGWDTLAGWTDNATIARLLRSPPDPIVIDIRDTYTLGPLLGIFGRMRDLGSTTTTGEAVRTWERTGWTLLAERPVSTVSLVGLVALVTNTLVTVALGDLTRTGIGLRLVAVAPFLLGLRSRASGTDLRESVLGWVFAPQGQSDQQRETK